MPPTTPPTIAPTFNSLLVAVTELVVEAAKVGVEETGVGVEATGLGVEVDWGTGDDSGPPETKISECRPIGRQIYLQS